MLGLSALLSPAGLTDRLPCLAGGSANSLADTTHSLSGRLAHPLTDGAQALADSPERLTRGVAQLSHGSARSERLSGRIREPAECLARGSTWLNGLLRRLAEVVERLRHSSAGPKCFLAQVADVADCVVDGLDEAFEDLGIAVERREGAVENVVEVLEAHLEPRLYLNSFDVDLDLSDVDVDTGDDLEEVRKLGTKREVRFQLLDVDIDLVDVHFVDVDEHIRVVARVSTLEVPGVEFARGTRS